MVAAQAQKVTDPINDCAIFAALCEQGGRLMEDGKGVAAETLRGQLVCTHCDLKLSSPPATKPMTAAEIYAAACDSAIVVSGVAKFGKDPKWRANPATAFSIGEPDVFVTNYHVFNETQSFGFVGMTRQGKIQPVTEILAASRVNDTVISRAPGLGRRSLTLRDDAPAGTPVDVIGHPDGHFFSLSQGTIARHALAHYAGLASAGHRLEGLIPSPLTVNRGMKWTSRPTTLVARVAHRSWMTAATSSA